MHKSGGGRVGGGREFFGANRAIAQVLSFVRRVGFGWAVFQDDDLKGNCGKRIVLLDFEMADVEVNLNQRAFQGFVDKQWFDEDIISIHREGIDFIGVFDCVESVLEFHRYGPPVSFFIYSSSCSKISKLP